MGLRTFELNNLDLRPVGEIQHSDERTVVRLFSIEGILIFCVLSLICMRVLYKL